MPPSALSRDDGQVTRPERYADDTRADVVIVDDEALVRVHGDLDLFSVEVLEQALTATRTLSRVVIDLKHTPFLDLAAMRRIERAARESGERGQQLRLEHPPTMVLRMIELMRLGDLHLC